MPRYYGSKVDGNHKQIVRELRALGYRVDDVHIVKKLGYDIVVTGRMTGTDRIGTVRVEIKTDEGRLTADEMDYHNAEPYPETLIIAKSTEDVLDWYGKEIKRDDTGIIEKRDMGHAKSGGELGNRRGQKRNRNIKPRPLGGGDGSINGVDCFGGFDNHLPIDEVERKTSC